MSGSYAGGSAYSRIPSIRVLSGIVALAKAAYVYSREEHIGAVCNKIVILRTISQVQIRNGACM